MILLALVALLALPSSAAPDTQRVAASTSPAATALPTGTLDSSAIRLNAGDVPGAIADADKVIANGGGADAYAARADAERAQGQPMSKVLADYGEAAKLDPRYIQKYNGLIDQNASEANPEKTTPAVGLNGVPIGVILFLATAGVVIIVGALFYARRREGGGTAPGQDEIHTGGKEQSPDAAAAGAAPAKADAAPEKAGRRSGEDRRVDRPG